MSAPGQPWPADAGAIAEEAYLYAFPMIVGYKVMHDNFIDPGSGQFKAPINHINNEARVFTPKDTTISTPNSDTPYSMALLDLRAEPMVLCTPEIEKGRYYDVQLVDLYTHNYGCTAPARKEPRWEKYWNFRYSIVGAFKTAEERAKIPSAGAMDGGGEPKPRLRQAAAVAAAGASNRTSSRTRRTRWWSTWKRPAT